jgi:hypothetical protein
MNVLDELAMIRRTGANIWGFVLEVHMNQPTVDELMLRAGRVYPYMGADAIAGIRLVVDNGLPWNVSEWVKFMGMVEIERKRLPVFPPDPIRDLEGNVVMP